MKELNTMDVLKYFSSLIHLGEYSISNHDSNLVSTTSLFLTNLQNKVNWC